MANREKPNEMEALADFLKEMSIEEDIVDVTPPSGSGEGYPQSVYKIENDFGVTLSELGRKEVAHLISHFEINNNAVMLQKQLQSGLQISQNFLLGKLDGMLHLNFLK